jgi:phenylacetate-CoA ligase
MFSLADERAEQSRWRLLPRFRDCPWFDRLVEREFLPFEEQRRLQGESLQDIAAFAARHVPYWRELFANRATRPGEFCRVDSLPRLPVLGREEVVARFEDLQSAGLPSGERPGGHVKSSGTTGVPVRVNMTATSQLMFSILWQRQTRWFRMDPLGTLLDLRIAAEVGRDRDGNPNEEGAVRKHDCWRYLGRFFRTGPEYGFNVTNPAERQLEWIRQIRPHYLHSYPGFLEELALAAESRSPVDSLRCVIGIGSQMTASLRERLEEFYRVPVQQTYGLNEIGKVAVRCDAGRYHVHAEHCIVEIVDADGQPCRPGETGRILVTALRNYAMPLFRYDTGDLARAVDSPCPCERTLPSFDEIAGRFRRFHGLTPGTRQCVNGFLDGFSKLSPHELCGLRAYQLHQDRENRFSLRVKTAGGVSEELARRIEEVWQRAAGNSQLTIVETLDMPRSPSGKHLDFLSDFYEDTYARPSVAGESC